MMQYKDCLDALFVQYPANKGLHASSKSALLDNATLLEWTADATSAMLGVQESADLMPLDVQGATRLLQQWQTIKAQALGEPLTCSGRKSIYMRLSIGHENAWRPPGNLVSVFLIRSGLMQLALALVPPLPRTDKIGSGGSRYRISMCQNARRLHSPTRLFISSSAGLKSMQLCYSAWWGSFWPTQLQ